jgi:alpha-tubulin suppressor-like RCC1 family protein
MNGLTVSKIASSGYANMILTTNNRVFGWGAMTDFIPKNYGFDGTSGTNTCCKKLEPYSVDISVITGASKQVANIFLSPSNFFLLTSDGYVYGLGSNQFGNIAPISPVGAATAVVSTLTLVTRATANYINWGEYSTSIVPNIVNTMIVTTNRAYIWGESGNKQVNQISTLLPNPMEPIEIIIPNRKIAQAYTNNLATATAIYHFAALTDGCTYPIVNISRTFTNCTNGNLYYYTSASSTRNSLALGGESIVDLKADGASTTGNYYYAVFLTASGKLYSTGGGENSRLGNAGASNFATSITSVVMNGAMSGKTIVFFTTGFMSAAAVSSDNTLFAWGYANNGELGASSTSTQNTPVVVPRGELGSRIIIDIQGAYYRFGALTADGRIFLWGAVTNGALGTGLATNNYYPKSPLMTGALNNVTLSKMALGGYYSLVLDSRNNKLYAWGAIVTTASFFGTTGFIGIGNQQESAGITTPTAITMPLFGGKTITDITASAVNAMALTSDGSLYVFGDNAYGTNFI